MTGVDDIHATPQAWARSRQDVAWATYRENVYYGSFLDDDKPSGVGLEVRVSELADRFPISAFLLSPVLVIAFLAVVGAVGRMLLSVFAG